MSEVFSYEYYKLSDLILTKAAYRNID